MNVLKGRMHPPVFMRWMMMFSYVDVGNTVGVPLLNMLHVSAHL